MHKSILLGQAVLNASFAAVPQNSPVSELRSTYRGRAQPNNAASRGGFRPVRWETPPSIYRISFNANGGNDVPSQELSEDGYAAEPESPRQDGYAFMGWYTDSGLTMSGPLPPMRLRVI